MSYCPRCGSKIPEYEQNCPCCGYWSILEGQAKEVNLKKENTPGQENTDGTQTNSFGQENLDGTQTNSFGQENLDGTQTNSFGQDMSGTDTNTQSGADRSNDNAFSQTPRPEQRTQSGIREENQPLSLLLQIIIIALIIMMPGIGSLVGIVAGVIFMGKEHEQYRKFGKIVMIVSLVSIAFYILCCCIFAIIYMFAMAAAGGVYY